jgi:hypothetical protein
MACAGPICPQARKAEQRDAAHRANRLTLPAVKFARPSGLGCRARRTSSRRLTDAPHRFRRRSSPAGAAAQRRP